MENNKNSSKKPIILSVLVIVAVITLYFISRPQTESVIRIGALIPLSGPGATLGEWMQKGAFAARDEINATGGINGKLVEIVVEDDKCGGQTGIAAYRKMYDVDEIHYFAGPLCAAARIPVLKASEKDSALIVTTGLAVTYGQNTTAKTFNVLPNVSLIVEKILNYGFDSLGSKKVSLLSLDDEFGQETVIVFTEEMQKHGISNPHIEKFTKGTGDMRSQITKIINDSSDTVLVAGFTPDYAVFMKQAKELGLKKTILALSPIQAPDAANANKGTGLKLYYPHPSLTSSESAQKFLVEYQKKDPTASIMSPVYLGSGYDAVKIIAYAIGKCGDDASCAQKELAGLTNFPGANGNITFGNKGNINSAGSMEIRALENGTFSKVE